ncbi:MAG: VPLPA-CTERM sorting domain-containing protein [Pseudomonadota bacterium]
MGRLKSVAVVAAGLSLSAPAGAVTFDPAVTSEPEATITTSNAAGTVTVDWTAGSFSGTVEFQVENPFQIFFTSIVDAPNGQQTGVTLDRIVNGVDTRLTTSSGACASAPDPVGGTCDLFSPVATATRIAPGTAIAAQEGLLAPGTYRLGFFEGSNNPLDATAVFTVSEVPLPAGAALLLSGLVGFAALRRSKTG